MDVDSRLMLYTLMRIDTGEQKGYGRYRNRSPDSGKERDPFARASIERAAEIRIGEVTVNRIDRFSDFQARPCHMWRAWYPCT